MVISKKTIIFQGFRGGGGPAFSRRGGGVQMLYMSKETHKICDFSGGSGATIQPLDPRMYPFALHFGLEKMPSDPVAAKCIIYILC